MIFLLALPEGVRRLATLTRRTSLFRRISGSLRGDQRLSLTKASQTNDNHFAVNPFERLNDIFAAMLKSHVRRRAVTGMSVGDGQDPQLFALGQLVMDTRRENSPPDCFLVRVIPWPRHHSAQWLPHGRHAAWLHTPLGRLVP